jgi:hypothetical protein
VPNAYSYALRTITMSCKFPYVRAPMGLGGAAYPSWMTMPPVYWPGSEQVVGMASSTPWMWLGLLAVALAARSMWRIVRRREAWEPRTTAFVWAVVVLSVAGSVTLMTALTVVLATMRYLGDIAGAIALLGGLGAWSLHMFVSKRTALRRVAAGLCWLLAGTSIAVGLGFGIEGQYKHFRLNNPALLQKLEQRLSVCDGARS